MERTMRVATVLVFSVCMLVVLSARPAQAQAFEVGGGIALSCKAIEGSPCEHVWGRVDAGHFNWWASPSLVIEARAARLDGPTTRIVAVQEQIGVRQYFYRSYTLRDERRTLLQASVLYHFLPGHTIRPFVGGGAGSIWWRGEAFCSRDQVECQQVLPAEAPGGLHDREFVASFAGGVAIETGRGVILRGGLRETVIPATAWRLSESAQRRAVQGQLPEMFFSVGYRW
jgi:hypothetical protein